MSPGEIGDPHRVDSLAGLFSGAAMGSMGRPMGTLALGSLAVAVTVAVVVVGGGMLRPGKPPAPMPPDCDNAETDAAGEYELGAGVEYILVGVLLPSGRCQRFLGKNW
mmetsp:Transcript_40745/g.87471  ORF Transcript_40745/g.87471 Transcript_40745/m.87471 type:complete len:108 (-) Transcript_40745:816-1139(-)